MFKLIPALTVALYFVKKVWEQWNIRGALLFSLLLQSFLTLFAPFRISTRKSLLLVLIWCAYLTADAAANFAIGLITNSQRNQCGPSGSLGENGDLLAFWAPFLLLHLGCPDTITAFSLEDNELWRRHMFSLILQAVAALYVLVQSLPGNKLLVPTLLMLIAGVIKYAERIYALYLASLDRFRDFLLQKPDPGPDYAGLMKKYASMRKANLPTRMVMVEEPEKEVNELKVGPLSDSEVVHYAYHFFETFKGLVVNLMFSMHARKESRDFFSLRTSRDALRVLEVELNFIYGVFYTKMMVMHSWIGYFFRFVAFGSVLAALGLFHFKAKKTEFDSFNVKITYVLLLGALALEVVAFLMLIFSDWTFASLKDPVPPVLKPLTAFFRCLLALKRPRWYPCEPKIIKDSGSHENGVEVIGTLHLFRMWSGSVSAYNFIGYCLQSSPTTILEFPSWWKIFFGKNFPCTALKQKLLSNSVVKPFCDCLSSIRKQLPTSAVKPFCDYLTKIRKQLSTSVVNPFCDYLSKIREQLSTSVAKPFCEHLQRKKQKLTSNSFVSGLTRAFCFIPKVITSLKKFLDEIKYVSQQPLTKELWNFIFEELKAKSDYADSLEIVKRISSSRGEWVLTDYSNLSEFVGEEVEYDERVLLWHIATDICYHIGRETQESSNLKIICKLLSDYMLYLLVMRPTLMSNLVGIGRIRFQDTQAEAERLFKGACLGPNKDKEACEEIFGVNTEVKPVTLKGNRSKSVLFDACRLAKELDKLNDKWLLMSKVWVELLSYAATHCRASAHAEQISKGGELITFVWLLLAHLGLGHYFQTTKLAKLIRGK